MGVKKQDSKNIDRFNVWNLSLRQQVAWLWNFMRF